MIPTNLFAKEFSDRREGLKDVQQERNYMSCLSGSDEKVSGLIQVNYTVQSREQVSK